MILAVDVCYHTNHAVAAGVSFEHWTDSVASQHYSCHIDDVQAYESGQFYKRELPCILQLLNTHQLQPSLIVIDGYVYLDGYHRAGLGQKLYESLGATLPVIGVAKTSFAGIGHEFAVYRGQSQNPLYVTAIGIALAAAKQAIAMMHGSYRFPTLLKHVDQLCRGHLIT